MKLSIEDEKRCGSLIRTVWSGDPSAERDKMVTSPTGPMLDPMSRVLTLPLQQFENISMVVGGAVGLPAGVIDIASANLLVTATPCDAPLFGDRIEEACARLGRDVMLVRTGLFPETMNPVTVDVALVGPDGPLVVGNLSFLRQRDRSLWLVPPQIGPFIEIRPNGLALQTTPPFVTWDERVDGVCKAASEIVRIVTRRGR